MRRKPYIIPSKTNNKNMERYLHRKLSEIPTATSVGTTTDRPSASSVDAGFIYFDTDLGKMIVSNGTDWVNMDGVALS